MMGGKRAGPRPVSTSPNAINIYPTIIKEKWLISSEILPCLTTSPPLYAIQGEEWILWYLYLILPPPPTLSTGRVKNIPRSPWLWEQ